MTRWLMTNTAEIQLELAHDIAQFYDDPLGHVLYSYPWGTGPLAGRKGPKKWQREYLEEVGREVMERRFNGVDPVAPLQMSTSSGHGIGKSALVAWLIRWIMDTRPFAKGIVTANTVPQLRTKTWSELAKWHNMGITKDWWEITSGQLLQYYHKEHKAEWRCDGQTAKEENSESFAGLHAANSTPFYIFDEAAGIPDKIYEVRQGGLTDGEPMVFDFGNPTRNTGRFFQNMTGKFRHRFIRRFIDSTTVEYSNTQLHNEWLEDYGYESDYYKVRVRGLFPDAGSLQLIPMSSYDDNVDLDTDVGPHDPLIMGVDVARFGDDSSVIWLRQGRDAESQNDWRRQIFPKLDTMQFAARIAEIAREKRPDAIMIDGGGVGGGVVDRCRQLGLDIIEVNFGGKATQAGMANMRSQMWANLRDALLVGVRLPNMEDLRTDLTSVEYGFNAKNDLQLESKDNMKKRGLSSPDLADALALTYALPVHPKRAGFDGQQQNDGGEYNPFD
tara:strand:+ start:3145 stop:4644 length:1500 start_codon:yes stop_codon:yes gene_type:complete